jgi:hypothetical protein
VTGSAEKRAQAWTVLRSQRPRLGRAYVDAVLAAAYPSVPEPQRWIAFPENPVADFRAMDELAASTVATTTDQRFDAITVLMDAAPSTVLFAATVVWPGATVKAIDDIFDQWATVSSNERRRLVGVLEEELRSARRAG